jgi:hypothetical protein
MSQKSSLPQAASFVSQVLKRDSRRPEKSGTYCAALATTVNPQTPRSTDPMIAKSDPPATAADRDCESRCGHQRWRLIAFLARSFGT